ncbi:MAG: leucine-rich repeat-containing protein kinase family protein [Bacteroidia bacterium]
MQTLEQLKKGQLKGIKHLKLSDNLTEFPIEILDLADTLEILDLSFNKLKQLPVDFNKLKHLKIAFFSDNLFEELPEVFGECPKLEMVGLKSNQIKTVSKNALPPLLRWLILTNNQIPEIPKEIGSCFRLQKLALAGNQIEALPEELANCTNLELIRISANRIKTFPDFLLRMPRLAWLAYAGNPIDYHVSLPNDLKVFDFNDIQLETVLGQGASGIIYKSRLKGFEEDVAVKIFKGQVTSDGFPETEMDACLLAGNIPHLVEVKGKIINHPDSKDGLVMSLIPDNFKNLGNPPSFESCSRDMFKEGTNFTTNQIFSIARGVANVAKHIHSLGICHGDLYAHNVLYNEDGNHLLGDFGAATFYDIQSDFAPLIERIEVRAYGYLLEDMLLNSGNSGLELIINLKDMCTNENVEMRPNFNEICDYLKDI